ncbi:MAG: DNA internalization-related competence protein ComEC/Rec2, partial [Oscillospiraceae bacterium]|nr:DNA internalization-related competence protein ComEC/Rec2 [Oscillospiraceae bacterium]
AEYDYYTRLHVQRTERPKLDLMLYDYRGSIDPELEPGQMLAVTAKLRRSDLRYGERSDSYVSKDIYLTGTLHEISVQPGRSMTQKTLSVLCSRKISNFAAAFFSPDTGVFMRSLMLGDKTDFYRDIPLYASMRGAGFMHIVAVSGMHIAFLVGMIQLLFGARPASSVAGILLVWFFVFMTGASPSAVRAGTMQTILLMAPVFRRENDGPTSLAAALALILLVNPFSCASVSLQMSFSAMAGMILLAEPLTDAMLAALRINSQSRLRAPVAVIAASLAVLLTSAPVTVLHFGTLAVYSPLTNLLGLWAVSLCFCFGYLSCLSGMLFLPLGRLLALPAEMLARYLMTLARLVCRLPHHLVAMRGTEMLLWLLLCYLLAFFAWHWKAGGRLRIVLPLSLCVLSLTAALASARHWYRSADAVVAALDVGQGACVCVLSGDTTLMFDCGGQNTLNNAGETAAEWLESAGRNRVDTLVLSHLHEDHANGVPMLLELIPVRQIVLSPDSDSDAELLPEIRRAAEAHGTELVLLQDDSSFREGNIAVQLFSPPDTGEENEHCIISLVSVGDYDILCTGDSPKRAELQLIETHPLPDTELLIVGHHGSDTSTDPAFLDAVRAEQAVISVGRNNSYGHPSRQVLARLQSRGMEIYRTDRNGTVEVRVNASGNGMPG